MLSLEICGPEQTTALNALAFCAKNENPRRGPLDDLLIYFRSVLPLGTTRSLDESDVLGRVLLLGLVSGAETYFRSMIARLVDVCPVCRAVSSDQMLSLAAVDYYGQDSIGLGLLENISFATKGEIAKNAARFTGIDWNPKSSVSVAVAAFEALAHFRHAAVHARGELSPRNTKALGVYKVAEPQLLMVRLSQLHDAAGICLNAARAFNRHAFDHVVQSWIANRIFKGNWNADRATFGRLTSIFRSRDDGFGGATHSKWLYDQLNPSIVKALAAMGKL